MSDFQLHTIDTAPEGSREILNAVVKRFGFLPNIYATFAESPAALKAYVQLTETLAGGSFAADEIQLMLLTVSAENGCEYCVSAHTMVAGMAKLDEGTINAVRDGTPIEDKKMAALHTFTQSMVRLRGNVSDDQIKALMAAGYTRAHVLEVALATSLKTLSNYMNHFAGTPLDEAFAPFRWQAPKTEKANAA